MLPITRLTRRLTAFSFIPLFLVSAAFALEPANPNANGKARSILNFMASLAGKQDHRLISGQFFEFENRIHIDTLKAVYNATGKWPALAGADYLDESSTGVIRYVKANAALKWAWNGGSLVTVSVHMPNPVSGKWSSEYVDLKTLLAPGTAIYNRWFTELDSVAAGLEDLQQAGVVVLFRPLHEMNGNWFWWGAKKQEDYIKVWRQIFDYFTTTKKLNNLLWTFGPNHGTGQPPASYYPGDAYCDIVGLDAYTSTISLSGIVGYPEMAALPKPFGLTEYGPGNAGGSSGDFDFRTLINNLKTHMPKICFFQEWSGPWAINHNKFAKEALNDPYVANRDDITAAFASPVLYTAPARLPSVSDDNSSAVAILAGFSLGRHNRVSGIPHCFLVDRRGKLLDISGKLVFPGR